MTVTKRLISGSLASWVKIIITAITQIMLVPIYLTYWDVSLYGVWIAIQAFIAILTTIDTGHQSYLGFEFLKIGNDKKEVTSKYLWSGIIFGFLLGFLQILVICVFIFFDGIPLLLDMDDISLPLLQEAAGSLIVLSFSWFLTGSVGGILLRSLHPFGYYARFSWWGVFASIITAIAPIIAIILGQGLFMVALASSLSILLFNIPMFIDMFKLLKKNEIHFTKPSLSLGWHNFRKSLLLSMNNLLNTARQQGVRLILSPLAGVTSLVSFTTMRTGANVALQGLNTITNPLLPELMIFLNQKNQEKTEGAFAMVWTVLVVIMAPAIVVLQLFMPYLFKLWTKGKVEFDPKVFALLSLTVLIYALAQPAIAIIRGNNVLNVQIRISVITAIIVILGMFILVPLMGILGAAISLVVGELIDTQMYRMAAKKWLLQKGLEWPTRSAGMAAISVLITSLALGFLIYLPTFKITILILTFFFFLIIIVKYYNSLPNVVKKRVSSLFYLNKNKLSNENT